MDLIWCVKTKLIEYDPDQLLFLIIDEEHLKLCSDYTQSTFIHSAVKKELV